MRDEEFEWDDEKARSNLAKHRIDFRAARYVFEDGGALDEIDDRIDYGEERNRIVGLVNGKLIMVSYTLRERRIRIISARPASREQEADYARQNPPT